jgi:serine/threonine-protein kinase
VHLGQVIAGKYRLDTILGTGGMGIVVGAMHMQLDQRIAIKFMSPLLSDNDGGLRRFMLEAKNAARIQSEHVVRVFDVASLEDGTPYIVMEYLDGEDLGQLLKRRGPLSPGEAADYILQAGEAIAEAHLAGIVHRDLKPGNLFCCRRADGTPLVKVLDFGVSKLLPREDVTVRMGTVTGPHIVIGSPHYAAPEQLRSLADVDTRADLWALGAILYKLVAGHSPFTGDTLLDVFTNVVHVPLRPLRLARPDISAEFGAVVARALTKDRDARFQTVADLARALVPFVRRRSLASVERIENLYRGRPASSSSHGSLAPAGARPWRTMRFRSRAFVSSSAAAVVALGWLLIAWRLDPGTKPSVDSSAAALARESLAAAPAVSPLTALSPPREPAPVPPQVAPSEVAPSEVAPTLPLSSPPQHPPAQKTSSTRRRPPDTSGFGGSL